MKQQVISICCIVLVLAASQSIWASNIDISTAMEGVTIASHGASHDVIVISINAPQSVHWAAEELQRDIALATGAKLAIIQDNKPISGKFISLGITSQAKAAGFSIKGTADGSYRIVTKDDDLYIFGPDTPDGQWAKHGGTSTGTANGVYTFLEKRLNVRWLMPGKIGRDVPKCKHFKIKTLDIHGDPPLFSLRELGDLYYYSTTREQYQAIEKWKAHLRVGKANSANVIDYNHNWWRTINRSANSNPAAHGTRSVHTAAVKALYQKHPEWFAMNGAGKRPAPHDFYDKLETTNPQLVQWFAHQAIRTLKARKRPIGFSLSPSDGRGWSQSAASKALYDPSLAERFPNKNFSHYHYPGMASLVLAWYDHIAKIVAKQYPQGRLAGYLYGQYLWPPTKTAMKLPKNFIPVIAFNPSYRYGLYKQRTQELFKYTMDAWAKVAPDFWVYYDLPTILLRQSRASVGLVGFPATSAIVTPAAPGILNIIAKTLVRDHVKGIHLYGAKSWSDQALGNYLRAKLEWNPRLDMMHVRQQWLHRAYGQQAGAVMLTFYQKLNQWFHDYVQQPHQEHGLTLDMLKNLYAAHYPQMEQLYLKAKTQPMTITQAKRLQLIGDNLIMLQWRLRNAGYIPPAYQSQLQRNNQQVNALLTKKNAAFCLFPGIINTHANGWLKPKPYPKVKTVASTSPPTGKAPPLESNTIVLYSSTNRKVTIIPKRVSQGAYFAAYVLKNQRGEPFATGILDANNPIVFSARTHHSYYLYIPARKPVHYKLSIKNASAATGAMHGRTLVLHQRTAASIQVYVAPSNAPVGVIAAKDGVNIVKPLVGARYKDKWMRTGNYKQIRILTSLTDDWRFHPDPDNTLLKRGVTTMDFDDSRWKTISSLDWWQFQGFSKYHGAAWYRIKFTLPPLGTQEKTRIYFGSVDGNAMIYLNGHKIHGHELGANYRGWNSSFSRYIPRSWLNLKGPNILAVKVTSKSPDTASGITGGVAIVGRVAK